MIDGTKGRQEWLDPINNLILIWSERYFRQAVCEIPIV